VKVLVTGADGFVGRYAVKALRAAGHTVTAAVGPGARGRAAWPDGVAEVELDLSDARSVAACAAEPADGVIHLAAVASGRAASDDPAVAWAVNAEGTAALCAALAERRRGEGSRVLVVSTAEVYGRRDAEPARESDRVAPASPYAASKAAAEIAARAVGRATGLAIIIARPFPHTGPGQDERFAVPAFARRLRAARQRGLRVVKVGNLEPVRELLDVRDVVAAYLVLLERGIPGETYNIATGTGVTLAEVFRRLAALVGVDAIPEPDPELVRSADLPFLVGDARKLREATGWTPAIPLDQTLRDVVHAQAD
jgi:GDP-4-dehydro-6-deoxy-D-mannose reductase